MARQVKPAPAIEDWEVLSVFHIVDGDTVDLEVRRAVGQVDQFTLYAEGVIRVRVVHLDTPERGEPGHDEAMGDLEDWVIDRSQYDDGLRVTTQGRDAFGRYLGDVYIAHDRSDTLTLHMVRDKHWAVWTP
jgi:endonuclease YncB( thermonuclease family)